MNGAHSKLGALLSLITDTARGRLKHLAHAHVSSTEALIFFTTVAAASAYWYIRQMATDRSAGTDSGPKAKSVRIFASPLSESYG